MKQSFHIALMLIKGSYGTGTAPSEALVTSLTFWVKTLVNEPSNQSHRSKL